MFFNFLNFLAIFFIILKLGSGKNDSKPEKKKFSLFFGLSQAVSAWNEARMMFFFIFFAFSKFSRSGRVKTVLNEKNFLSLLSLSQPV